MNPLLALLRKNAWTGVSSGDWVVLAIAIAMSLADAVFQVPDPVFLASLLFFVLIGQAIGASVFSVDFKEDNVRFLEYLPLRRSHIWLANWLWGLAGLAALVFFLTWQRSIFSTPPAVAAESDADEGIQRILFAGRWSLPLAMCAGLFWAYSASTFWRLFVNNEALHMIPNLFTSFLFVGGMSSILAWLRVLPRPQDMLGFGVFSGVLFSAAGCAVFSLSPVWWSPMRRFTRLGAPALALIIVLSLGCFFWTALGWRRLDPNSVDSISVAIYGSGSDQPVLIAHVCALRSGAHEFSVDPDHGTSRYLGRNLGSDRGGFYAVPWKGRDGQPRLYAEYDSSSAFAKRSAITEIDPASGRQRDILPLPDYVDTDGRCYEINRWGCSRDGSKLMLEATAKHSPNDARAARVLFVTESAGRAQARLRIASRYSAGVCWLSSPSGRVLTIGPEPIGKVYWPRQCVVYDVIENRQWEISFPGTAIHVSADLKSALCTKLISHDGQTVRSLVSIDLETGDERTVMDSLDRDPPPPADTDAECADATELAIDASLPEPVILPSSTDDGNSYDDIATGTVVFVDDARQQAVWFAPSERGKYRRVSLIYIDLQSGTSRVLVAEKELPKVLRDGPSFRILTPMGFTKDGAAFVYWDDNAAWRVDVRNGRREEIARRAGESMSWSPDFSPGLNRALVIETSLRGEQTSQIAVRFARVFEAGGKAPVTLLKSQSDSFFRVQWFDEDRLVLSFHDRIEMMNADGTNRRIVFDRSSCYAQ